ncbi:MAG: hypothetical protein JWL85_953, partial [Candidatus Saccharibacteria bacterium]|nr:hypothetical protein [Candidatus Saccharibacteria bacterium]
MDRSTRLRWRRQYRRSKRQVEDFGTQTENNLERLFFRRIHRLIEVRRFVFSWLLLLSLLIIGVVLQTRGLSSYYQELKPSPGGIYTEGVIGSFTNANPLYAVGSVDASVSHLVFAGLMKYDQNNRLVGDLAEKWAVDERGVRYTITLKDNLKWQDGKPLTSSDVVFTYQTIQNPDAKSPLLSSWQGIKMETPDPRTVVFVLPNTLSSFPYALTNGIVPKHLLGSTPANQLRSARFNTVTPVGSGPFKWGNIEVTGTTPDDREEKVGLIPNEYYHGNIPKLQRITIRAFRSEKQMLQSFENQELTAMSGLDSVPDNLRNIDAVQEHNIPFTGEVIVFLKTSNEVLKDVKVRQALVHAVDQIDIVKGLNRPAIVSRSPLLPPHIGYDKSVTQLPPNIEQANKLLDEAGWIRGTD